MWCCPKEIENALWAVARRQLGAGSLRGIGLADAIVARSRIYTSDRDELVAAPRDPRRGPEDLAARALFFTVADVAKVMVPLAELGSRQLLPSGPLRVADVGAGVGAMSLGLLAALPGQPMVIDAVDHDRAALDLFAATVPEWSVGSRAEVTLRPRVGDVGDLELSSGYDLILVGSLLNELADPVARRDLVGRLIARLDPRGALILIEPALRSTSRALHQLRDQVIESGLGTVFAPCVRGATPCPALADPDDWCHEDRPTQLPPNAARLAAATGLRQHGLKFSYLVVRRDGAGRVADPARSARVVSQPRKLKGLRECFVCSEAGRLRLRLLKRHRGGANREFESAVRGDVLGFAASDIVPEIGPEQPVTLDHVG